jgi:YidC/Oxa1 family membrane protein insertase
LGEVTACGGSVVASTPYRCSSDAPAPAGQSEVDERPFYDGFVALVDRFGDVTGIGAVGKGFAVVVGVLLTPLAWFTGLTISVAAGLTWGLQLMFPLAQQLGDVPGAPDPVVTASILLLVIIRLLCFPLLRRSARSRGRLEVIRPHVQALQRQHKGDRDRLNQEMMALYKRTNANPINGCLPIILILVLLSGVWQLLRGLTVRSEVGTFAPRFTDRDSALFEHLLSLETFSSWQMDMTAALPQSGGCALLLPYVAAFLILAILQIPSFKSIWRPGWRSGVVTVAVSVVLSFALLPSFFLVLRIADSGLVLLQSALLRRTRQQSKAAEV